LFFNRDGIGTAVGEGEIFYKLQDDETTWIKERAPFHFLMLGGAFSSGPVGAMVGAGGTIIFSEDSGSSWQRASLLGDSATRFNAVCFAGQKKAWAVGSKGHIFRSNGGGRLWRQVVSGTTTNLNDVYFTSVSNGWAVGDDGTILSTRDGGISWTEVSSHVTQRLERIVFASDRGWAVGYGGTLLEYEPGAARSGTGPRPVLEKRN